MNSYKKQHSNKKVTLRTILTIAAALPFFISPVVAEQLVYTPVNPSFGGNPLNGSNLLNSAQAQKRATLPIEDFGYDFGKEMMIIAQGDGYIIFTKNGTLYKLNTNSNTAYPIILGSDSGSIE